MTISAIILAHYKEREQNLPKIVEDLFSGTVKPDKIIMFIDNPEIEFEDERVTVIRSSESFLPNIRFAIGLVSGTDYCFFIDDDLSVRIKTLENFADYVNRLPAAILGYEGSILGHTSTPYSNDVSVPRGDVVKGVDVIIRTYFLPAKSIVYGFQLRLMYPELPQTSLDDIFLSLGNKYLGGQVYDRRGRNYVIPVNEENDLTELPDGGVGQSYSGKHYENRNIVCKFLMDKYE